MNQLCEFFLHVDDNGLEHRYKDEPGGRSLRIRATDTHERTGTKNFEGIHVRPRGFGWSMENADEFSSTWVRDVVRVNE
jgi:hypothetical protein